MLFPQQSSMRWTSSPLRSNAFCSCENQNRCPERARSAHLARCSGIEARSERASLLAIARIGRSSQRLSGASAFQCSVRRGFYHISRETPHSLMCPFWFPYCSQNERGHRGSTRQMSPRPQTRPTPGGAMDNSRAHEPGRCLRPGCGVVLRDRS
jgi:hypothetical protein